MKRILALILIASVVTADDAATERLKTMRAIIEAKLKIGDLLREKGDLDGALEAYRDAIRIYEGMSPPRGDKPKVEVKVGRVAVAGVKQAIAKAQQWLAAHQNRDGRWDADDFMRHDPEKDRCDGSGGKFYDVGVTGLSLLALMSEPHKYKEQIRLGLKFLIENLDDNGCFGSRASQHFMYNTALATAAMCEGYRVTNNGDYERPAQQAVNFLLKARNPYLGWRYEPRGGENDTSVTSLCVLTLVTARFAGLQVDPAAFEGARQWITKMTDREFGQVGYNMPGGSSARPQSMVDKFPPHKTQAMTAAGILCRILTGEHPRTSEPIRRGAQLCARIQPAWDERGFIDMYYWYMATRALYEVGGAPWRDWTRNLHNNVVPAQRRNGAAAGSWDPVGPWGTDGGRVYSTAILALTLQASIRPESERIFGVRK